MPVYNRPAAHSLDDIRQPPTLAEFEGSVDSRAADAHSPRAPYRSESVSEAPTTGTSVGTAEKGGNRRGTGDRPKRVHLFGPSKFREDLEALQLLDLSQPVPPETGSGGSGLPVLVEIDPGESVSARPSAASSIPDSFSQRRRIGSGGSVNSLSTASLTPDSISQRIRIASVGSVDSLSARSRKDSGPPEKDGVRKHSLPLAAGALLGAEATLSADTREKSDSLSSVRSSETSFSMPEEADAYYQTVSMPSRLFGSAYLWFVCVLVIGRSRKCCKPLGVAYEELFSTAISRHFVCNFLSSRPASSLE